MGLFDTIHLKCPLACPVCGGQEHSYQPHAFEDVMAAIIANNTPDPDKDERDGTWD